jgi:hexosaminidase
MKKLFIPLLLLAQISFAQSPAITYAVKIIPEPVSIKQIGKGQFTITKNTVIAVRDQEDMKAANFLNDYLHEVYGIKLDIDRKEGKDYIRLETKKFIQAPDKDAYDLTVTRNGVAISGDTYNGTFYGVQTLIQMLPTVKPTSKTNFRFQIPFIAINDYPRFNYRGMHLDVGRHFFPVSFVKKYIDYIALHKMNYFHWHLTEDQGWRIEIKKYPNLTNIGGWRNGTIIGRYPGTGNDNIRYGGFYTQDEVRDVVKYAADRNITVVPEIEMPGHSSAAIAAYPWLSCFPEKETVIPYHPSEVSQKTNGKKVQETWGVFEDVFCAGKDSTFMFLQDVVDEVLTLFPSKYIHIGGDECPKSNWKKCPSCQARMKALGQKDEHELQSYFIQRMEKYINSKGRTIIGWDEILEGGLAPNAIVMSWRGEQGGITAAKQNHNVIMTPGQPVYFDHSQTRNEDSIVIGGYNSIEAVYAYEPIPKELNAEEGKFVLGSQANVWTEYMGNERKVEYMIFPRMSALSEVLWSPKEKRDWNSLAGKMQSQFQRYNLWGANYSKAFYEVKVNILPTTSYNGLKIEALPRDKNGKLLYQSGSNTTGKNYTIPFIVNQSGPVELNYYRNNSLVNRVAYNFSLNKATGRKITLASKPNDRYPGQGGAFSLVNGIWSNKGLSYPDWIGYTGEDIEAIIDLGKTESVTTVKMHTLEQKGSWVYLPQYVEVFTSKDGINFSSAGKSNQFVTDTLTMGWINVSFHQQQARFIKVVAKNFGLIPEGSAGSGNKAWLMADELQVF